MIYALLIYEKPADFARRDPDVEADAYVGAWREYHRAIVEAGIFVGGNPLDVPPRRCGCAITSARFRMVRTPAPRSS
jgi:hypothetical protein